MRLREITVSLSYTPPRAGGREYQTVTASRSYTVEATSDAEAFRLAERELKRELLLAAAEVKPWCNYYEDTATGARR